MATAVVARPRRKIRPDDRLRYLSREQLMHYAARAGALALFVGCCVGVPLRAATVSAPRATGFDTCTTLSPPTDTIGYRVYAVLRAPLRRDTLPTSYVDLVLDGLRHGLVLPQPLTLPAYAPFGSAGLSVMAPAILGEVEFTLDAQGKVSDIHLTQSSLSPALDRNLYDAPRRADSLGAFPPEIGVSDQGNIRFFVSLTPFQRSAGPSMEFFGVRMPAWRPGSPPAIDPRQDWQPTFPVTGRQAAVGDSVTVEFVVDERGMPITTTVRVLTAQYIDYARLVMDAALKSRYVPATAAGCAVKGLFQRSWKMSVTRKYE